MIEARTSRAVRALFPFSSLPATITSRLSSSMFIAHRQASESISKSFEACYHRRTCFSRLILASEVQHHGNSNDNNHGVAAEVSSGQYMAISPEQIWNIDLRQCGIDTRVVRWKVL